MKRVLLAFLVMASGLAHSAFSQSVDVNLSFGMRQAVSNEFGQILPGTGTEPGALIQILGANAGVFPPATNGAPHPSNPVLRESRIGTGVDPSAGPLGKASDVIAVSRSVTNTIVARIFNKPTIEESSFYTDSQLYNVPVFGGTYGTFWIVASQTTNEVDTTDHDADGLSRSWEMSYGTDAANPDSDNDGMMDGHEILAGTDALDPASLLLMVEIKPASGGNLLMTWDSVPGKTYQLEYTTNSLTDVVAFSSLNSPVTAVLESSSTVVTNGSVPPTAGFRVRLVTP
ncbi:MAG TPA: thrombospondin type 3 repeat-containing protein [Kiritimatiellia bacterium]|nr:thrombospondin type 3 repeat-containing protein [Kiritimatiellia bacterium]HMP35512.1 thrombospondin type 3 repeat-containing protein [Kiritimatiellia bacterium]